VILETLNAATRGTIVLAIDGLGWEPARSAWTRARMRCLTSTFPSTSVTAWMTALTGIDPSRHLGIGMVYRLPRLDCVVHVISNRRVTFTPEQEGDRPPPWDDHEVIIPHHTLFQRAGALGVRCVALGRDIDRLASPWASALLCGAERPVVSDLRRGRRPDGAIADPKTFTDTVIGETGSTLRAHRGDRSLLVWVYVNLDDHIHLHGYDGVIHQLLQRLETAALTWADRRWTVLAHGDHGQTPCRQDDSLRAVWRRFESPAYCRLPSGGAGRVRWLYPKSHLQARMMNLLSEGLGDHAMVVSPDELAERGLLRLTPALRQRIGEVVAVAATAEFPVPNPRLRSDHGALTKDEMLVPLATWPAATASRRTRSRGEPS